MENVFRKTAKAWLAEITLPSRARSARRIDRLGLPQNDPGPEQAIAEGLAWLAVAQDRSATSDGGVARHFSLLDGWSASYPETTGYIAETLLAVASLNGDEQLIARAKRMLDWLVSIQFPDGAFQGGMVNQTPRLRATFDTGQILIGLAEGVKFDERYRSPMIRAADWLVATQGSDGSWRKFETPFAAAGEKVFETHASIGLFRAAELEPNRGYKQAAMRQVDWALGYQRSNGWFDKCCLTDRERPLTHTLGYAIRGIIEAYLHTRETKYLESARLSCDGLMQALEPDGRLSGRLTENWNPAVEWVCLTGTAQIAECLLIVAALVDREDLKRAGMAANSYVRRTLKITGAAEVRGGVKGSFPVDGWYGKWQFLNWACKFMIDANRAELKFEGRSAPISRGVQALALAAETMHACRN